MKAIIKTLLKINILSFMLVADIPRTLSYQGYLTDNGEVVPDGPTSLTFRLYDDAESLQFEQLISDVQVIGGIFSVIIGGDDNPLPDDFNLQYHLGIVYDSEELSPRIQLTSTAYSLISDKSITSTSVEGDSNVFPSSGSVGINTTDPGHTLDVNGNINFSGNLYQNGALFNTESSIFTWIDDEADLSDGYFDDPVDMDGYYYNGGNHSNLFVDGVFRLMYHEPANDSKYQTGLMTAWHSRYGQSLYLAPYVSDIDKIGTNAALVLGGSNVEGSMRFTFGEASETFTTATAGQVGNLSNEYMSIFEGGNVTIGLYDEDNINTSDYKLDVAGAFRAAGNIHTSGYIQRYSDSNFQIRTLGGDIQLLPNWSGSSSQSNQVTIKADGRVGIGQSVTQDVPGAGTLLELYSDYNLTGINAKLRIRGAHNLDNSGLTIQAANDGNGYLSWDGNTVGSGALYIQSLNGASLQIGAQDGGDYDNDGNTSEIHAQLSILTGSAVGIGGNSNLSYDDGWAMSVKGNLKVVANSYNQSTGDVIADGTISGSNVSQRSDKRLKKNIQPMEDVLEKVLRLEGVHYNWKDKSLDTDRQIGFIAQDVEKIFPELVHTDSEGYKSMNYGQLTSALVESVKELDKENRVLEDRIAKLEEMVGILVSENTVIKGDGVSNK